MLMMGVIRLSKEKYTEGITSRKGRLGMIIQMYYEKCQVSLTDIGTIDVVTKVLDEPEHLSQDYTLRNHTYLLQFTESGNLSLDKDIPFGEQWPEQS